MACAPVVPSVPIVASTVTVMATGVSVTTTVIANGVSTTTTVIATGVSTATAGASTTTVSGIHEAISTFKGEEQA